jgi:transcriptional regulator with XRE-family HTH domain
VELALSVPLPDTGRLFDFDLLRTWREDAGLTCEQVWAGTGCSVAWLRDLEGGRGIPSLEMLSRLARFYGHDPRELLAGAA